MMDTAKKKYGTIDEYIALYPDNVREIMEEMRRVIRECAPDAEEAIAYGIPTFKLAGKNLVHFAAYKNHIGFYPASSGIAMFKDELSAFKISTGTVRFPLNKPIPYELVRKIVIFRVKENNAG
ncbi:MAG: hypothetical protein HPY53_10290 [Brevinematales bacterium]|nr:hypothetical protein [Brevinematales bacterium]